MNQLKHWSNSQSVIIVVYFRGRYHTIYTSSRGQVCCVTLWIKMKWQYMQQHNNSIHTINAALIWQEVSRQHELLKHCNDSSCLQHDEPQHLLLLEETVPLANEVRGNVYCTTLWNEVTMYSPAHLWQSDNKCNVNPAGGAAVHNAGNESSCLPHEERKFNFLRVKKSARRFTFDFLPAAFSQINCFDLGLEGHV